MDGNQADNRVAGLVRASQKKQQEALARTKQAIDRLINNQQKITVRSVAREAGVSVSYIYKYPELAYEIQSLRDGQKYDSNNSNSLAVTKLNKDNYNDKNKELLVKEISHLKLHIDSIKSKKKSTSELQKENINLQLENQKLKQELEFTKQQLAEIREFILSQGRDLTQDRIN